MKFLIALIMTTAFFTAAQANVKTDKQGVDTACAQEAATANCGNAQVGTGLLKCLHAYKKANKGVHFSETCKTAMATFEADKKATGAKQPVSQPGAAIQQ